MPKPTKNDAPDPDEDVEVEFRKARQPFAIGEKRVFPRHRAEIMVAEGYAKMIGPVADRMDRGAGTVQK